MTKDDKEIMCQCDCNHEHTCEDEHEDFPQIHLVLEDDTEVDCLVLTTMELRGKKFVALLPVGEERVLLYELKEIEEGIELVNIESDEEFELVSKAFLEEFGDE
ncbi:hypothetical protein Y919_08370 [Caloranaerobacter azorensis H53214]|uniref:DUF1292 domain-containing protein n=2 Tax=Caloranaerobacter azorensis TaxID=116090 RepID=A0A1M5URS2_9FIRM|nr:DUF1292 domain-containing protein [Caloranaerobacter azorensis]KGG80050.1 hypothetical protein Y919_08370 [Caloranaerobacter azorensis H53214]SHH65616.1 Protein of unknown function [Caloranaerobacter azorensis DSM 13643]